MPIYKYYTAQGCLAQGFTVPKTKRRKYEMNGTIVGQIALHSLLGQFNGQYFGVFLENNNNENMYLDSEINTPLLCPRKFYMPGQTSSHPYVLTLSFSWIFASEIQATSCVERKHRCWYFCQMHTCCMYAIAYEFRNLAFAIKNMTSVDLYLRLK